MPIHKQVSLAPPKVVMTSLVALVCCLLSSQASPYPQAKESKPPVSKEEAGAEGAEKGRQSEDKKTPVSSVQPSLKEYIRVYRSVMDPKIAADVFGRRIAKRYVAIQVTVANRNSQYQFLIHDISLDVSSALSGKILADLKRRREQIREEPLTQNEVDELKTLKTTVDKLRTQEETLNQTAKADLKRSIARLAELQGRLRHPPPGELSSDELSLVRGVAEKGQVNDRRNQFLRFLRAAGTIAGGLTGVTRFGPSYSPTVAAYSGPFLTAFVEAFPDFTVNQLIRLNDSAYVANKIVARQQSLVLVAFIPQAQFMSSSLRKEFWRDPTTIVGEIDFRQVQVLVDGVFITEVEEKQPSVTSAFVEPDEMKKFQDEKPKVKGYIIGQSLGGSTLNIKNDKPEGLSITVDGTPEDKRINFTVASDKPVAPGTVLQFEVTKKEGSQLASTTVAYQPSNPTLESIDPPSVTSGVGEQKVKLIGTNFLPDATHVWSSGVCGDQEAKSVHFIDPKSLEATITFPKGMKAGDYCTLRVSTPGGITPAALLKVTEGPKPNP